MPLSLYVAVILLASSRTDLDKLQGPILNAGIVPVSLDLHRSFTDVAKLGGYLLLTTGAMGPFASAFGRKYGKRPLYVFSSIMGTIGIIVSEAAVGYNQLLAGRIIQGIGVAAYESLAIASVGDIFFVHQRGPAYRRCHLPPLCYLQWGLHHSWRYHGKSRLAIQFPHLSTICSSADDHGNIVLSRDYVQARQNL